MMKDPPKRDQGVISHSGDETRAAGRTLAQRLQSGDVVLLTGPLGSGKTTFAQGIAEGLGAETTATSPSFVIVNEYAIGSGHSVLRHIDLYRLSDPAVDVDRIGLTELMNDPSAITVIEWADKMPTGTLPEGGSAPGRTRRVRFRHGQDENERVLDVESNQ